MNMLPPLITCCLLSFCTYVTAFAQPADSSRHLHAILAKYIHSTDNKVAAYHNRVSKKTLQAVTRLSHWEAKIKGLLEKVDPAAAADLFSDPRATFTSLLQTIRQGDAILLSAEAGYDAYRDQLATSLNFLAGPGAKPDSSFAATAGKAGDQVQLLQFGEAQAEALQQFIHERKRQLAGVALRYVGGSRYLKRINKEAFYYAETLKNYRLLFSDSKKTEQAALELLSRIPAFQRFVRDNSALAPLFRSPADGPELPALQGLQTRISTRELLGQLSQGNPTALEAVQREIQQGKNQADRWKEVVLDKFSDAGEADVPDFKPHLQKTKTFFQRLEFGFNVQFSRNTRILPATSEMALSAGYRLNDRSVAGIGASYKVGFGSIRHIRFTNAGAGLRGFLDWKLKKQVFLTGGFEFNHSAAFKNMAELREKSFWQQSALLGLTRKMSLQTKMLKGTSVQLLYDLLSRRQVPASEPVVFRVGYSL